MPTTTKKAAPKASSKASAAKAHVAATHPTWVDMIKVCLISPSPTRPSALLSPSDLAHVYRWLQECIATHPEDARGGVSRPTIKKVCVSACVHTPGACADNHR